MTPPALNTLAIEATAAHAMRFTVKSQMNFRCFGAILKSAPRLLPPHLKSFVLGFILLKGKEIYFLFSFFFKEKTARPISFDNLKMSFEFYFAREA